MLHRQFVPKKYRYRNVIVIAGIFVVLLAVPVTRGFLRRSVGSAGTGIARGTHGVTGWFGRIGETLRFKGSLVKENDSLKNELAAMQARLSERDMLARENEELKAAYGRSGGANFVLAAVLAKPPKSPYDTLVIDGGEQIGFAIGQTVYANGETPIGTIESVLADSAVVRLYSSAGEKTEVRLDPSSVDITLVGRGGGSYMANVPHELSVAEGSVAVSKGIDPSIIGKFEKVTSDSRDAFQTLVFSSPVNMSELSFVQVRK